MTDKTKIIKFSRLDRLGFYLVLFMFAIPLGCIWVVDKFMNSKVYKFLTDDVYYIDKRKNTIKFERLREDENNKKEQTY